MFSDPFTNSYIVSCFLEAISKYGIYKMPENGLRKNKMSIENSDFYSKFAHFLCAIPNWIETYDALEKHLITKFPSLQNIKYLPKFFDPTVRKTNILGTFFVFQFGLHFILFIGKCIARVGYSDLTKRYIKLDNIDDFIGSLNKAMYVISSIFKASALKAPYLFIYSNFIVAISILPIAVKAFHLLNNQYKNYD